MASIALEHTDVVVGVDTHKDEHVAVALDGLGRRLGELFIAATNAGYGQLLACAIEPTAAIAAPLGLLTAVLAHQEHRASQPEPTRSAATVAVTAEERRTAGRYPLLDLSVAAPAISSEAGAAVTALTRIFPAIVPEPLVEAGLELSNRDEPDRYGLVETWLDDPTLLDPRLGFWIGVAAAPILETAAAGVAAPSRSEWNGAACPVCGGPPQASVIAEESGEFMAGSPRNLVCSRCATWWAFARAVCPTCGEDDSRRIAAFLADEFPWARVDACETCHTYLKGFDFRQPGARDVIPLVDDVATLALDLWAGDHGYHRSSRSLAGV